MFFLALICLTADTRSLCRFLCSKIASLKSFSHRNGNWNWKYRRDSVIQWLLCCYLESHCAVPGQSMCVHVGCSRFPSWFWNELFERLKTDSLVPVEKNATVTMHEFGRVLDWWWCFVLATTTCQCLSCPVPVFRRGRYAIWVAELQENCMLFSWWSRRVGFSLFFLCSSFFFWDECFLVGSCDIL